MLCCAVADMCMAIHAAQLSPAQRFILLFLLLFSADFLFVGMQKPHRVASHLSS
jgi:hypothetical protein